VRYESQHFFERILPASALKILQQFLKDPDPPTHHGSAETINNSDKQTKKYLKSGVRVQHFTA